MKYIFSVILILQAFQQLALAQDKEETAPCFTGTLLAQFSTNVSPSQIAFIPYFFFTEQYGIYNSDSSLVRDRSDFLHHGLFGFESGITDKIDITLYLNESYSKSEVGESFDFGDTSVFLGFQISRDKKNTWIPDLRVLFGESFPTGKFDRLGPRTRGANSTGSGSYETFLIFITRKIFYTWPNHPYNWNLNVYYINFSHVDVKGTSIYGGAPDTKGTVRPGNEFLANLAYEWKLNRYWGWGIDIHYNYKNSTSFNRDNDSLNFAGLPSSSILSLAPEIEFCYNQNFGIIVGGWFSVAGRNSVAFRSGVISLYYAF